MSSLKKVEEIYRFLRAWENDFSNTPSARELENLKAQLSNFFSEPAIEIKKLSELAPRLNASIAIQDLVNLIIPFERALQKSLRDDEFLITESDAGASREKNYPLILILENIRSAFNVGSFFRMAEALGAQEIFLCGYTPTPENEKLKKTTMGTEHWIPWKSVSSIEEAIRDLKARGFRVIGLETSARAQGINKPFVHSAAAFVFGNERFGLGLRTLQLCDEIRKVELSGQKNSLNVATCGAIVCHEWIRQWTNIK